LDCAICTNAVNTLEDIIDSGSLDFDGIVVASKAVCKTLGILSDPACESVVDNFAVRKTDILHWKYFCPFLAAHGILVHGGRCAG